MILSGKTPAFEKVLMRDDASLALDTTSAPILDCRYHYHPETELTFIASGVGRVLFGTEPVTFRPGDLALIPPGVPHLYVTLSGKGGMRSHSRVVKFGESLTRCGLLTLPEFRPVAKLLETRCTAVLFENAPGRIAFFDRMEAAEGAERLLTLLEFLIHLSSAPHRLLGGDGEPPSFRRSTRYEPIERAVRYMRQHFREKLTLAMIAEASGMEQESFRRFFRRTVRSGVSEYLIELRLIRAGQLLRETGMGISEIAVESGFRNLSNFNRLFAARRGMTPREYHRVGA